MPRPIPSNCRLLFGPYRPPRLAVGDRETCLYRDCDVVVTGWTDAPISWPRGLPLGQKGHPSIVVNEVLARAIRQESAAAIRHHWGVSVGVISRWRKALGVSRISNEGSRQLIVAAAKKGGEHNRVHPASPELRERRRLAAVEGGMVASLREGYARTRAWTAEQLALLGTLPDAEVAAQTGRSVNAVRLMRARKGMAKPAGARP